MKIYIKGETIEHDDRFALPECEDVYIAVDLSCPFIYINLGGRYVIYRIVGRTCDFMKIMIESKTDDGYGAILNSLLDQYVHDILEFNIDVLDMIIKRIENTYRQYFDMIDHIRKLLTQPNIKSAN